MTGYKKRYANLKCQYRKCRSKHVSWIIENPTRPTQYDMIQKPIGFCTSTHLEAFMRDYNSGYYMKEGDIIPRTIKRQDR